MSRQYLNGRWCVRCPKRDATPYLKKNKKLLQPLAPFNEWAVDVGCGNGRNSVWAMKHGYKVFSLDMAGGCTPRENIVLGQQAFPVVTGTIYLVLCNYVLMFLNKKERAQVYREIKRVSLPGCKLVVELYPAKDSFAPNEKAVTILFGEIIKAFGKWKVLRRSKNWKCILEKP